MYSLLTPTPFRYNKRMRFPFLQKDNLLPIVYIANLLFSFHFFLILYINSSFLNLYATEGIIGLLYALGSIGSLLLLLTAPKLLSKIGNQAFTLSYLILEFIAVIGLTFSSSLALIAFFFVLHGAVVGLVSFGLDIFVEKHSTKETETGGIRGLYLTLANTALVIAPTVVAFLLPRGDFGGVYLASALFLIPTFILIRKYLKESKETFRPVSFSKEIEVFRKDRNLRNIFVVNLVLQMFYAWMVIYTPIYLSLYIGFTWDKLGILFTFMLLPFLLFELPLGKIADTFFGEKEILVAGLAITAAATSLISYLTVPSFILWAIILFLTRTGASAVEIMTESYFFKHVNAANFDTISVFRMARPISFIITPLIAGIALGALPYRFTFLVLVGILLLAIRPALEIKDTR
ncbi:MAG: MFS transporter [Patescibacteria group bacterium]